MLVILSGLAPYKPSVENLATEIGVSKNNVPYYLVYLECGKILYAWLIGSQARKDNEHTL